MTQSVSRQVARELVKSVPFWWHTFEFPGGVVTPGQTPMEAQLERLRAVPRNLTGASVLDVGCWDGFFSFQCEQRGAEVTAVDDFQYVDFIATKFGVELAGGEGFDVAKTILGSDLELHETDYVHLEATYDVVLYFGVLYHQRYLLKALEKLRSLTGDHALVESHYRPDLETPEIAFYRGAELNEDPTNFWGPSLAAIPPLLEESGFERVELLTTYWDNDHRAIFRAHV